jgi:hypothetical protein
MNLEEKRLVQTTETALEASKQRLAALSGGPLDLEVNWDSFAGVPDAIKAVPRAVTDLEKGLAELCKDEFGKEAVRAKITKLKLAQKADQLVLGQTAQVKEGALEIEVDFRRMGFRADHLVKHLSKQL